MRIALEGDDSLPRIEALADARAEHAVADGALPDPEVTVGYQNIPVNSFSTSDDMMTMAMVGVRQRFPPGRTRQLLRNRGEFDAQALRADHRHRTLEIRTEVRQAWLDWYFAHQGISLARTIESSLEELAELAQRRLATAASHQRDVSQAQLELAALSQRIIELEAQRDVAAAELSRWLGGSVKGRPPGELPDWQNVAAEQLRAALPDHPALQGPAIRVEQGRLDTELARETYKPMWMVEFSYGLRRGADMTTGRSVSDTLTGMVSVNVPLFSRNRQDRRLQGAMRERDAARHEHRDQLRQLAGMLESRLALWQRLNDLAALYRERLLPAARDTSADTLSAYRNDRATFDELIRARITELDLQLEELDVERQRGSIRIGLLYLEGQ
ncbi:MAG: TolC family protein [Gammaproteobacteria bacterium]|nr:TolC family protein [Gammaproteobacteria bacterium]